MVVSLLSVAVKQWLVETQRSFGDDPMGRWFGASSKLFYPCPFRVV